MNITVHVAAADLRGLPFSRYEGTLHNLITEQYATSLGIDELDVVPAEAGERTRVLINGKPSRSKAALDIVKMCGEITDPAVRDGYFG